MDIKSVKFRSPTFFRYGTQSGPLQTKSCLSFERSDAEDVSDAEPPLQPNEEVLCLADISSHKIEEIHIIFILISRISANQLISLLMTVAVQNTDEALMQSLSLCF